MSDGLDISIIGEIEEDEVLRKIKIPVKEKRNENVKKSNIKSLANGTSVENKQGMEDHQIVKIENKKKFNNIKLNSQLPKKDTTEKLNSSSRLQKKSSSLISSNLKNKIGIQLIIIFYIYLTILIYFSNSLKRYYDN